MNPTSGHYAAWNIALSIKRSVLWQNPTLDFNSITLVYSDPDLIPCALTANVNAGGVNLVAIGLPATALGWAASLLFS